jgi:hypothetical protein
MSEMGRASLGARRGAEWRTLTTPLFKRTGKKVWAAGWFHDGSAKGPKQVGYGNNWVVIGIVVNLPMPARPVCLPVAARLVRKDTTSASRLRLATQTTAGHQPDDVTDHRTRRPWYTTKTPRFGFLRPGATFRRAAVS